MLLLLEMSILAEDCVENRQIVVAISFLIIILASIIIGNRIYQKEGEGVLRKGGIRQEIFFLWLLIAR